MSKDALATIDKMEGCALNPKMKFTQALAQALPPQSLVLPPALIRQAITIIKASESLQECSEVSLFTSIAEVAQAGLSLDLHLGQCYLVPFAHHATVMYGYRGLQELARRSGEVNEVVGEIRYSKDEWLLDLGANRRLVHKPFDAPESKRGEKLGAYAIADMKLSRPVFEYMDAEQILKIKNAVLKRKKTGKPSVWETEHENEMWRKTPIRRLAKRLPQSAALIPFVQAAIRDEYRQQGIHQVVDVSPTVAESFVEMKVEPTPPEVPARESEIKEKPKAEQKQEAKGPITPEQFDALYDQIAPLGLTMQIIIGMMKKFGHKGSPKQFPAARYDELIEMMVKAKRK
jgi:recombination protein RecT